ncbi:transcription intermediary factor 1-alpha-like [Patiria miniata]|uniref:Uncharacterized protein n=1 Tax=Patiria miniata TaxID=46514 RepID=A0A914A603_PATMI|nr:transcription intermediary factor 1-alpha-like [Patiria miniata]
MAARHPDVTVQSVLGKISRDHLQCPVCKDRFTEPKVLDCLHSFCQKCLREVKRSQRPQVPKLVCPLCRLETILKGDISDLPSDFKLSALVDEVNVYEKLLEGQRSDIKCQACDEENQAVSRCMDCDHFLCNECQAAHRRVTLTKSHQIYTLAQLQSGEVTYKSKIREYTPKCAKHSDQNLNIYCNTCEKMVCTTCAFLDHEKHSCVDLPKAVDKCKQDVARMSVQAEQNKAKLKTDISEVDDNYRKLNAMHADTTKKISSKADKEVARITKETSSIRDEEQKLKQEADTIFKDRAKTLETARATNNTRLTQTEKKLDEVNQFVTQASCYEILDFKLKLMHNLKELNQEQSEKGPDNFPFIMDFDEGPIGRSLGRLVLEDTQIPSSGATAEGSQRPVRWELKRQMKTFGPTKKGFLFAEAIAAFSNNEIVTLDSKHKKLITFLTNDNLQSDVISKELQLAGLTEPTHVSVNRDDEIIVLHKRAEIKIFNRGYQPCLHQFLPGTETGNIPTCLAVDGGDVIAVGYRGKEEISLHKRDGSLIRRIPAPKIEKNLAIYKQQLFYTCNGDNNQRLLSSIDSYGRTVFSVHIPSNIQGVWHANGLCCDKDGNIYVAVSGWPLAIRHGEIQHFSHDGYYIGCVISVDDFPGDVTCTPAGELAVAAVESVKVYHRV